MLPEHDDDDDAVDDDDDDDADDNDDDHSDSLTYLPTGGGAGCRCWDDVAMMIPRSRPSAENRGGRHALGR